jgi:hypothetical protein
LLRTDPQSAVPLASGIGGPLQVTQKLKLPLPNRTVPKTANQDSFCSSENEQGAGFFAPPPLKIALLSQASRDGARSPQPPETHLIGPVRASIGVRIVVIEPFWRNSYISKKVLT